MSNPVYDPDLHKPKASSRYIYFYYLTENPETVRAYLIKEDRPIKWADMAGVVKDIAIKIQDNNFDKPDARTLGGIPWQRKSYFVVVLDDFSHKLETGNAVTFDLREGGSYSGGNHTFRDGRDLPAMTGSLSGFYCLNHMRKKGGQNGEELGDESEEFLVKVNHGHGERAHQDAGTNMGPPIGGG